MAIINLVKYNGGPDVLAWKYPSEELSTWTQLLVNESQEVVLYKSGQALDVFQSGRHTLDTANIPFLNHIINLPFGGRSPFTAEVWYVNKAASLDIKWGTSTPIQLQDPRYSVFIPVRAFGQFGVRVENAKMFLIKLVGTLPVFDKTNLVKYFRGLYLTKVKDAISSYLVHKQISIMEINAYIEELSVYLEEKMRPVLHEYGIDLLNFCINDISVPEDDPAVMQLKNALAKKAEMNIIGYNYQQERSFDTMESAAKNAGDGSELMGAGIGLGMGVAVGGAVGGQFGGIAKALNTNAEDAKLCPGCKSVMPKGKRFCADCGYDTNNAEEQPVSGGSVVCSHCGANYARSDKFCPQCGDPYNPCPQCGADLEAGSSVCPACRYEFPSPCPGCGAALPSTAVRFCPECGRSLQKSCPSCGVPLTGQFKFCPECGKALRKDV